MNVVVLGGGSTGEHFVGALRRLDDSVQITLVERRLVGGECSYYACMPTKTMLRTAELSSSLDRAPGLAPERPAADGVWTWRGQIIPGQVPCTGAVMRMPVDGGPLEVVAWGLRNP